MLFYSSIHVQLLVNATLGGVDTGSEVTARACQVRVYDYSSVVIVFCFF